MELENYRIETGLLESENKAILTAFEMSFLLISDVMVEYRHRRPSTMLTDRSSCCGGAGGTVELFLVCIVDCYYLFVEPTKQTG